MYGGLLKSEACLLQKSWGRGLDESAEILQETLFNEVFVKVLHSDRYDACLACKDSKGLDSFQLELGGGLLFEEDWKEWQEDLKDDGLDTNLLIERCLSKQSYVLYKVG